MRVGAINANIYYQPPKVTPPADSSGKRSSGGVGEVILGILGGLAGCSTFVPDRPVTTDGGAEDGPNDAPDSNTDAGRTDGPEAGIPDGQNDGPLCQPGVYTDTDFTSGTVSGLDRKKRPGSIMLPQNWTYQWNADSGMLPTQTAPAWSLFDPASGFILMTTDPVSNEPALQLSSMGTAAMLYYETNPSFNNLNGWAIEWRNRPLTSEGAFGASSSIWVMDGAQERKIGELQGSIEEAISGETYIMDTITAMHTYRFEAKSSNFRLYVDDDASPVIERDFISGASANFIRFNDTVDSGDGETYWNRVAFYNGGDKVPYIGPGTYVSDIIDSGSTSNNFGSGAYLSFNGNQPAGTSIIFESRSGNTLNPDDGTWSNWETAAAPGYMIASTAAQRLQLRIRLITGDPLVSPRLDDYSINYCNY
jgi:hypothetical protein